MFPSKFGSVCLGRKKYVFKIYMILADFARPGTAL
jgi:hypothetical protein